MFLTAEQVVAAISYLIPGFIALKILYVFGFRSKRSDAEWAIWSLLGSAAIAPVTARIADAMGVAKSASTFAESVKSCVTPILSGSEAGRVDGVVNCASTALSNQIDSFYLLAIGAGLGVVLGLGLVLAWAIADAVWPWLAAKGVATVWDRVMDREQQAWVEILLGDGRRLQGLVARVASDVETDKADIFLRKPAWLDLEGQRTALGEVEGVWLPRSEIKMMVIVR